MAVESYGLNSDQTVKLWSKTVYMEAIAATYMNKFMGESEDSVVCKKDALNKSDGDRVRMHLAEVLSGDGVSGSDALEGNEEAGQNYTDDLIIDELRHATRVSGQGTIETQRVPFDLRSIAKDRLKNWWAERLDVSFMNTIAGNTAQSDVKYSGLNATIAPSTGRHLWADVSETNKINTSSTDQAVGAASTDIITLEAVRAVRQRAIQKDSSGNYRIRPINIGGGRYYVMFLHPNQVTTLKNDVSSAGSWYDVQQAALQGGDITENPIFTGALGMIDGVILHESENIPKGVHSSTGLAVDNSRRAVFCGAQAANIAFGQGHSGATMSWAEKLFDYGKTLGIGTACVWGMKKTQYNSKDYGTFVLTSYAADV